MSQITVSKLNHLGIKQLSYPGTIVERGTTYVCLQAVFSFNDNDQGYVVFRRGDVMTEWFFSDRWYNIFQINDVDDGRIKGWYCNVTRPAVITEQSVAADDLALDVFVKPNGEILVLDEDEFAALDLPFDDREAARRAVEQIRQTVAQRATPFDQIDD